MKINKKIILICSLIPFTLHAFFDSYKASQAYKNGNFERAQKLYKDQLINNPEDPEILFNCGDVAYRLQEYSQAAAYFKETARYAESNQQLQEKAYYNAGNALCKNNALEEALEYYNKVLKLNSEHEKALHNKKVVEELLKQQENKDSSSKDEKKEKKDKQDKEDGSKGEKSSQEEKSSSQEQKEQDPLDKSKDEQEGKQPGQDGQEEDSQQNKSNKGEQDLDRKSDDQSQQHDSAQDRDNGKEGSNGRQDDSKQDGKKTEQGSNKEHEDSSGSTEKQQDNSNKKRDKKQRNKQETLSASDVEPQDEIDKSEQEYDLLKYIESENEKSSKKLFKQTVTKGMAGSHGQKNW